jgi:hypothetical protein
MSDTARVTESSGELHVWLIQNNRDFSAHRRTRAGEPIGFVFGVQLRVRSKWWKGALTPLPDYITTDYITTDHITTEYPGRTFAIIEIVVRRPYRQRGIGLRGYSPSRVRPDSASKRMS